MEKTIAVLSDTHGILRPQLMKLVDGVDLILHAGDIMNQTTIAMLEAIAPVYAVRGNCDEGKSTMYLPKSQYIELGKANIYMLHDLSQLDIIPKTAQVHVVISGHTHKYHWEKREGVLYLNPGGSGAKRFSLPITMIKVIVRQLQDQGGHYKQIWNLTVYDLECESVLEEHDIEITI